MTSYLAIVVAPYKFVFLTVLYACFFVFLSFGYMCKKEPSFNATIVYQRVWTK